MLLDLTTVICLHYLYDPLFFMIYRIGNWLACEVLYSSAFLSLYRATRCLLGESSGSQEDQLCTALVNQLNKFADKETLIQFLRCFLLESNSSSVRWQAHCLALHIYRWAGREPFGANFNSDLERWKSSVLVEELMFEALSWMLLRLANNDISLSCSHYSAVVGTGDVSCDLHTTDQLELSSATSILFLPSESGSWHLRE